MDSLLSHQAAAFRLLVDLPHPKSRLVLSVNLFRSNNSQALDRHLLSHSFSRLQTLLLDWSR